MVSALDAYVFGITDINIEVWTPEESDVSAMESAINALFTNPDERMKGSIKSDPKRAPFPLSDYYIRYAGVIKDRKRLITGKDFHKSESDTKTVLESDSGINVWGGGSYYFTVVYNATDKRLVVLTYNAGL